MSVFTYKVIPVSKDGTQAYNDSTKSWGAIETILDIFGALGWEVVGELDTTFQRQIILKKTAA